MQRAYKHSRLVLLIPANLNSPEEEWKGHAAGLLLGAAEGILDRYWLVNVSCGRRVGGGNALEH